MKEPPFFVGSVEARWIDSSEREMKLTKTVKFIDAGERRWTAPKGSVIDGASVPRVMWNIFGSPFIGKYRRASVMHDVYCKTREHSSEETHQMFYEAMLCDKVPRIKAWAWAKAVKRWGPQW